MKIVPALLLMASTLGIAASAADTPPTVQAAPGARSTR